MAIFISSLKSLLLNEWGIPVVSMVAAEMYIYHPSDKPNRIPIDALEPFGMAFAEIAMIAARQL